VGSWDTDPTSGCDPNARPRIPRLAKHRSIGGISPWSAPKYKKIRLLRQQTGSRNGGAHVSTRSNRLLNRLTTAPIMALAAVSW
jgi:hypothetical protein